MHLQSVPDTYYRHLFLHAGFDAIELVLESQHLGRWVDQ